MKGLVIREEDYLLLIISLLPNSRQANKDTRLTIKVYRLVEVHSLVVSHIKCVRFELKKRFAVNNS